MRKIICLLAIAVVFCGTAQAQDKEKTTTQSKGKILIAYFSYTGNTRAIATQIQQETGGDLFEIATVKPYSKKYQECVDQAKKEQQEKARPPLSKEVKNFDEYDIIFIGYPIWWGTLPMPMYTFLEKYNMTDKTVIPFCSHNGGEWARSLDDMKKLYPKAKYVEGITISGDMVKRSKNRVTKWLQKINMSKKK
jgi:flavodoxin